MQEYPNRSVRVIVPFAPGGPADVYARFIGNRLQEALGQSFVIDNRPGAGSIIGTGVHFASVLARLGIQDAVAARLRTYPNGASAMHELAADTLEFRANTAMKGVPPWTDVRF